jgi:hypothetical protein
MEEGSGGLLALQHYPGGAEHDSQVHYDRFFLGVKQIIAQFIGRIGRIVALDLS